MLTAIELISNSWKATFKKAYMKIAVVIITIAIVGFSTISDYGLSPDEVTGIRLVRWNLELITKGKPFPAPEYFKYDGTVFNFAAEAIFQIQEHISKVVFPHSENSTITAEPSILSRIKVKHPLTFLLSLVTYISIAGIIGIFCGLEYAWFAPIVLVLFPEFWEHTFFNFKDIPFAALFTLSTYIGAYLVNKYINLKNKVKLEITQINIYSILYGILVGLLTGIRFGGFVLIFFVLITQIVVRLGSGSILSIIKSLYSVTICYLLMIIAWLITTILCYPTSWHEPISWLLVALETLSKYPDTKPVLFDSQFFSPQALPWYYIPKWIMIKVPLIFQVSFILGLIYIATKYNKFSNIQRACAVLILLQVFLLPITSILGHSTLYDGMRHFLFVLPAMSVLSTAGLIWLYKYLAKQNFRAFSAVFIIIVFSQIVFDMVALHPYEYIYFNRISGGLANAYNRYETDYWELSTREAMEWLNKNASSNSKVLVGGSVYGAKLFSDPSFTVVNLVGYDYDRMMLNLESFKEKRISKPYYYMAIPKYKLQEVFPECKVVHQVVRQAVPLTIIKQCN